MNCNSFYSRLAEVISHKVGMTQGNTEGQCPPSLPLIVLFQRVICSRASCNCNSQFFFIKAITSPRDVSIVHNVRNPEIMERTQQPLAYALAEIASIDEILLTQ